MRKQPFVFGNRTEKGKIIIPNIPQNIVKCCNTEYNGVKAGIRLYPGKAHLLYGKTASHQIK